MKYSLLFVLILFSITPTSAQSPTFAPNGAKWTYGVGYAFGPTIEYREWVSQGDTVVAGKLCKAIVRQHGPAVVGDISNVMVQYEDSNRVYWYNDHFQQFTVLYDFNKKAGESWIMKVDSCDLLITVDSTDLETINGFLLKVLYISTPNNAFNGKVIQHIGHTRRPSPDVTYHCNGLVICYNFYNGLRCYEDSEFGSHDFHIAPTCDDVTSVSEMKEETWTVNVYPNPVTSSINLNFPQSEGRSGTLEIFDHLGEMVHSERVSLTDKTLSLNLSTLFTGSYLLKITDASGKIARVRFVKL